MSKTVDSRVVEMRFDNAQFERNVKTTMSTLERLKEKLKFSGAVKGLDDIEKSAKQVDMSHLSRGVDTVKMKFSAMEVVAMTALSNITTTAMQVGKSITDALTIDPVKDGFAEYETQMNAVQTILANTQKEGTTVKDVNKALDELNTYADKTIYNFTEMTRNIGTFTAAGVKLDASVSAIKGIANLAAVSGSNSQQASTAMYQLSQALAAGKVQLMDWNSVVNAGMGGQVFQDALIRTSENLGTGAKEYIEAEGSFRESLQHGWLTADVLTQTLDQFATAADTQEEYAAAVQKFVEQGYSQEEAKQMADMAKTANDAATKVKTFSQLIDTIKEALGSGWTKTWQLIFGDFEEAKETWTKISDVLGNIINKSADARNALVEKVMGNPYADLAKSIDGVTAKAEGLEEVVNNVIRGDYGNGQPRFDKLAEEGYNWARVQNMVNEQLGCAFRYNEELGGSQEDLQKIQAETIEQLLEMSDAQLLQNGLTQEDVDALRALQKQSEKTGIPLQSLLEDMNQLSGRELLFGSFENIGKTLLNVFTALKQGWDDVFDPVSAYTVYNILAAIHKKTTQLASYTEEHGDELRRTMAGLAAVLDIIKMTVGGTLKFGIKALNAVLSAFGMDTLDVTANLGDLLVQFDKWLKEVDPFTVGFQYFGEGIKFLLEKVRDFYEYISGIPQFKQFFDGLESIDLKKVGNKLIADIKNFNLKTAWNDLIQNVESSKVGSVIVESFKKALEEGITSIPGVLFDIGKAMLESIQEVLDINSPSKKMEQIGEWTIEGLFNGIKNKAGDVIDFFKELGTNILSMLGDADWGSVIAVGSIAGFLFTAKKLIDVMGKFGSPFEAIGSVIKGIADIENSVSKSIQAKTLETKMDGIKKFAEALLIVAGSIYILGNLNSEKLIRGGIATGIIASVLVIIAATMSKITASSATIDKSGLKLNGLKTGIASIGTAVLLIGATVKLLGEMNPDEMAQGFRGLVGVVTAIVAVYAAFGILVRDQGAKNIDKAGKMMKSMATTMLLMVAVVKLVSGLSAEEMIKGVTFATAFSIFVGILGRIGSKNGGNMKDLGKGIKSLVISMGLLVGVVKLIGMLSVGDITKGIIFADGFLLFVATLTAITKSKDGSTLKGLDGLLLSVSVSMTLMAGVVKMVSGLSTSEMIKGGIFAAAFVVFVSTLVKATTIAGDQQIAKISGSILAISVAVGIMAGISVLLGMVDTKNLVKGESAVVALCAMMAIMVRQLRGANDVGKTMTSMAIAIGVMAGSVAALSLIKTDKLTASTLALSTLMGMFAVIEKSSSVATTSLKTIVMMTAVVAALAGILVLMNKYDFNALASNAAALSTVMLGLAAATVLLGKVENVTSSAIGAMAGLALIMGGIGAILGLMNQYKLSANIETVLSLSVVMNALAGVALIASKIPPIPVSSSLKIAALMGIVVGISSLIVALTGIVGQIEGAEDFFDNGIKILEKIGTGIGEFAGSIISGFGEGVTSQLPVIGKNIAGFMNAFANIDKSSIDGIDMFATFVKAVLSLSVANIVDTIADKIGIGTGLDNFGEEAKKFGEAISAMSNAVSGENAIDVDAVENAKNAGTMLTELQKAIPDSKWFDGKVSLSEFGLQIQSFGNSLQLYGGYLVDTDFAQINSSLTQAKRMVALANSVADNSDNMTAGVSTFKNVKDIGTAMEDYGASVSALDVNKVSDAISLGYSLKTFISSLKNIDTSGTNSFKEAVSTLSQVELGGIQNTLNESTKSFETNGRSLVEALNSGMSSQENKASSTMSAVVASIKKSITDKNEEFKKTGVALITMLAVGMQAQREQAVNISSNIGQASASGPRQAFMSFRASGIYLGSGLVSGINDMQNSAYNAGFALGQAAVRGERAGQQSHSPSKATYQSGIWLGEGMINACRDIASKVFKAGKMLGEGTVDAVSTAMQSAEDLFDATADVVPVISPVVDLTDIRSGAAQIASMFNSPSLVPMANIRAISSMTNERQNGNSDVVSAINGLKKSLENTGNTYNNISGITYDSGTAVSDAIETLVRAAKIERRR